MRVGKRLRDAIVGNKRAEQATVWIAGANLAKAMKNGVTLVFAKNRPNEALGNSSTGMVTIRSHDNTCDYFAFSNSSYGNYRELARELGLEEVTDLTYRSPGRR